MSDASLTSTRQAGRFAGLRRAAKRFPFTLACAALIVPVLIIVRYGSSREIPLFVDNPRLFTSLIVGMGFGIPATVAAALFSETREWAPHRRHLLAAGALIFCVLLAGATRSDYPVMTTFFSLATLVFLSPALKRDLGGDAAWSRVYEIVAVFGRGFLIAAIAAITVIVGFRILDQLFNLRFQRELAVGIWGFCLLVVWPVQSLIRLPDLAALPTDSRGPAWFQALLNWIVAPLALITVGLLLLFAGYAVYQWNLPARDTIEDFTFIAFLCVVAWLAIYPLRARGSRLLKFYYRRFRWILAVLASILSVFLVLHIEKNGVNERYAYLALFAACSFAIALYLSIAKNPRVIIPPLSIALVLLAVAPGPWAAKMINYEIKISNFETLMADNGFLVDGRIVSSDVVLDETTERNLYALAWELYYHGYGRPFSAWLVKAGVDEDTEIDTVLADLGIDYVPTDEDKARFYYDSQRREWREEVSGSGPVDISGFDVVTEVRLSNDTRENPFVIPGRREEFHIAFDGTALKVTSLADLANMGSPVLLDLTPLIERLRANPDFNTSGVSVPPEQMAIEVRGNGLKVRFSADELQGKLVDGTLLGLKGEGYLMIGRE